MSLRTAIVQHSAAQSSAKSTELRLRSSIRVLLAASSGLVFLACGGTEPGGGPEAQQGRTEQPILGLTTTPYTDTSALCTEAQQALIQDYAKVTRIVVSSYAFEDCVRQALSVGVAPWTGEGRVGPYTPEQTPQDPFAVAGQPGVTTNQINALLAVTRSPNDARIRCVDQPFMGTSGGIAYGHTAPETWSYARWALNDNLRVIDKPVCNTPDSPNLLPVPCHANDASCPCRYNAGLYYAGGAHTIVEESVHTHGYADLNIGTNTGAPDFLALCAESVVHKSAVYCNFNPTSSGGLELIRTYGSSSGDCVRVPDPRERVRFAAAMPTGALMLTTRIPTNAWTPLFDLNDNERLGAYRPTGGFAMARVGNVDYFVGVNGGSVYSASFDTTTAAPAPWERWHPLPGSVAPEGPVAVASTGGELHVVIADAGTLKHQLRRPDGVWSWFADMAPELTRWAGYRPRLAAANQGGNLHVFAVAGSESGDIFGVLRHAVRYSDRDVNHRPGSWQGWDDVATGDPPVPASLVDAQTVGNDIHIVLKDAYQDRLRHGVFWGETQTFSGFTDVSLPTGPLPSGTINSIALASDSGELHVGAVINGYVYHTVRWRNGNWSTWRRVTWVGSSSKLVGE